LLAPAIDEWEKQIPDILAHVHLGVVDHLVILTYIEGTERYRGCCFTVYHPMCVEWFPELDDVVCNPPPNMLVTIKTHGDEIPGTHPDDIYGTPGDDIDDKKEYVWGGVIVIVHFCRHGEKKCF
jgi:hypothetical protein